MATARRSTDHGTVVIHALLTISVVILVATGLRIATDDPDSEWLVVLDPVLPAEHLWFYHLVGGIVLTATLAGYFLYVRRARLRARTSLDHARLLAMARPGRARWGAMNVAVFWILMAALVVEIVTGVLVFAGAGRSILAIHRDATFVCVACIAAHIVLHAAYGGMAQLARVLRPVPLVVGPPPPDLAELLAQELAARQAKPAESSQAAAAIPSEGEAEDKTRRVSPLRPRKDEQGRSAPTLQASPLASAAAVALVVGGMAVGAEHVSRPVLVIVGTGSGAAPVLDGDISDPIWARAKPTTVLTSQGGDFGGTHESLVEVRAVHDGIYAYFAFVWTDPTRSLKHTPLIKRNGSWYVAASRDDLADEAKFNEDKFAVLLAAGGLPLIGGAIHLARRPISDKPPSSTGRGLHYTGVEAIADVWQWRASHAGVVGHVDNSHFGEPASPDEKPRDPAYQYSGGYRLDPGQSAYEANVVEVRDAAGRPALLPRRLPVDLAAVSAAMGRVNAGHGESDGEGTRWWMTYSETAAYSQKLDAAIPDGTVLPGILVRERIDMTSSSIRGTARWAAGRWTLEVARRLYTGSPHDIAIKTGVLMWVAAFDHAEKRHTRHLRPFRLEVD